MEKYFLLMIIGLIYNSYQQMKVNLQSIKKGTSPFLENK
jgi:hypothetical protein